MKGRKGLPVLLALILVAGMGLYFAYINNDIARLPTGTTGSTLAELWETDWSGHRNPPADNRQAPQQDPATRAERSTRTARSGRTTTAAADPGATTTAAATKPDSAYAYAAEYGIYPGEAKIVGNRYLICVNSNRALPAKYKVGLAVCVENIYPENRMMERQAAAQYRKMYDAARKEDESLELIPFSAYRSTAQQKITFDREVSELEEGGLTRQEAIERALKTVQLPGCSEHETGLAIDITRKGVWRTDPGFADSKEFKWLEKHAHDYGFILRYPKGKESFTGVAYEPWHWRYVGVDEARKIQASNKCLEEYLGIHA